MAINSTQARPISWNGRKTLSSIKEHNQVMLRHDSPSSSQKKSIYINESGLYRFVSRSQKKEAEEFMSWVYEVVLPSIREHGWYATVETIEPNLLKNRLAMYEQKRKHITTIRDSPMGLNETLIKDVHEICIMLGQQIPEIKSINQIDLPLNRLE